MKERMELTENDRHGRKERKGKEGKGEDGRRIIT